MGSGINLNLNIYNLLPTIVGFTLEIDNNEVGSPYLSMTFKDEGSGYFGPLQIKSYQFELDKDIQVVRIKDIVILDMAVGVNSTGASSNTQASFVSASYSDKPFYTLKKRIDGDIALHQMHDLDENQLSDGDSINVIIGALRPTETNDNSAVFTSHKKHADIVYWIPEDKNLKWASNNYDSQHDIPPTFIKLVSAEEMIERIGKPTYPFCLGIPFRMNASNNAEKWTRQLFANQIEMVFYGDNKSYTPQSVSTISSDNGVPNNLLDSIEFK